MIRGEANRQDPHAVLLNPYFHCWALRQACSHLANELVSQIMKSGPLPYWTATTVGDVLRAIAKHKGLSPAELRFVRLYPLDGSSLSYCITMESTAEVKWLDGSTTTIADADLPVVSHPMLRAAFETVNPNPHPPVFRFMIYEDPTIPATIADPDQSINVKVATSDGNEVCLDFTLGPFLTRT